jgi:hypothetical protein
MVEQAPQNKRAFTAVPLFHVMGQGIRWVTIGCQFGLALPLGIISGAMAATNVELPVQ